MPYMPPVSLACRGLGWNCEWATRAPTAAEALDQFAQHAKCAHKMTELDAATRLRAESAAVALA